VKAKKILVAPLDWGLGHATRCIPIINELLKQGADVLIASSGKALHLLRQEFPQLTWFELPSYNVTYPAGIPFMLGLFRQLPMFIQAIRKEKEAVEQLVSQHEIDVVIADNRYGCRSSGAVNIFITHQLTIQMPTLLKWMQPIVNFYNQRSIKRFDQCWVPEKAANGLTGKLSSSLRIQPVFIGMLSRFQKSTTSLQKKYDLLVILSGPEPQRSIFEKMVCKQLEHFTGKACLVRGLPERVMDTAEVLIKNPTRLVVNHLPAILLQETIEASDLVLSRSGYSTIMDLYHLQKKAIFVPTPGQTEQEYLADVLMRKGVAFSMPQRIFDLREAMVQSASYTGFTKQQGHGHLLEKAVASVLRSTP
jgi:predicted glycosyltransferase